MIEKRISFGEIDDVDVHSVNELARVLHSEIKPLQITISVCVVAHEAVESRATSYPNLIQVG